MDSNSNFNQLDTPLPQKNEDYKIDIQMSKKKDKYIEINVDSKVTKYNNELKFDDFVSLNKQFKNAQHLKTIHEALQFSAQKGKIQITKIGNTLQITFITNYGVCNIQLFEVNNDPKPPLNNINYNNTNTAQPNDSNPRNEKNQINLELIKKEYEKNLENIKKEHKLEIEKIEKNYHEAMDEMKNDFATVLNSIRNQFKNEMAAFQEQMKKNASSNLIQVNNNNNKSNNSPGNPNIIDPNIINTINSLTKEVNELKKKIALLDSIPTKNGFELIKSWINPNKNMHFELIYSLKENGDDVSNFHSICDNEKNTLTVLEIEGGKKIGGYTTLDWSGNGENKSDKETFIFDLTKQKKYPKINNKRSIFCLENRGPCFGQACDLGIFNPMTRGWSNKNGTFITNQEISDGKDNFEINQLEIYKVVFE